MNSHINFGTLKNRWSVFLLAGAAQIACIAFVDWKTRPYISLGFLYLFPLLTLAGVLPRWALVLCGLGCAELSAEFSGLPRSLPRMGLEALALIGSALFVRELLRNRQLIETSQEQMRVLIGTSPAAILTVTNQGIIDQANEAADALLRPRDGRLIGSPIAAFIPELHYALRLEGGPQFRSALQCRVHRGDSDTFSAEIWFSTFLEEGRPKLAAIIADVSEEFGALDDPSLPEPAIELTPREKETLSLVLQGLANKQIADRMSVSESAVKNTLQTLFNKTGVRSRSQLVRIALEQFRTEI